MENVGLLLNDLGALVMATEKQQFQTAFFASF